MVSKTPVPRLKYMSRGAVADPTSFVRVMVVSAVTVNAPVFSLYRLSPVYMPSKGSSVGATALTSESLKMTAAPATIIAMASTATRSFPVLVLFIIAFIGT